MPGNPYEVLATATTPALIIYVLDISASMSQRMGASTRIEIVMEALRAALRQMVYRSTKGTKISPRYHIAMYAYSEHVYDLLGGIKTVDKVASLGVPELSTQTSTDTALAFSWVEKLLKQEMPNLNGRPAPLVCHMTDGEYTGDDPKPIVDRIRNMKTSDGNVLIENIFISDSILKEGIPDPHRWGGITRSTKLTGSYAQKLRDMSSPLPPTYRALMREYGYQIEDQACMMLPGSSPELVKMGFVMSTTTPMSR